MSDPNHPLYQDPDYVQGQISALFALVLALAQSVPREFFRDTGLQRLESLRTTHLNSSHQGADTKLLAIDHCEQWLRTVTS